MTTYADAVQRALFEANDAMASMADRALKDCPTGRRLLMAALEAQSGGKASGQVAAAVGLLPATLASRLHRAGAPSVKSITASVFRMRAAYLLWSAVPQPHLISALGLGYTQNFGKAVRGIVDMAPLRWVRSTTPAAERGVFWDFLRAGQPGWRRVALVPARKRWMQEVCCGA